jgi:hypothetical protein
VLTKSKLLVTLIMLVGVMAPLLAVSYMTPVGEVTGNETKMMTYSSEREGVKFAYPDGWLIRTERDYTGGEIIESISFTSPDQAAHGFVQVMKLNKPIPDYVSQAEKSMAPGFDSLNFRQTVKGERQGFVLSYKRGVGDARSVAVEYFFKKGEKVYRFGYFYPDIRAEQYKPLFEAMLGSLILP